MPFNGSGTFIRLRSWVTDAVNSVKIRADFHDDEDNGFAAGLSNCICKDGQTSITQNIPFNSRRIISLADPIDPQDAATKDYADTKMPLDGSQPITGDVIIRNDDPTITLDGKPGFNNAIYGDKNGKHRWAIVLGDSAPETGGNAGSNFSLINYADDGSLLGSPVLYGNRATGMLSVKADPTVALGIVTKQYADAADNTKFPITGGTITGNLTVAGNLQVNGHAGFGQNLIYFGSIGGPGYLQWQGGATYVLGGAGTVWHSGNFNPTTAGATRISTGRLAFAEDTTTLGYPEGMSEPHPGAVATGFYTHYAGGSPYLVGLRLRWLQLSTDGTNFFTVGVS